MLARKSIKASVQKAVKAVKSVFPKTPPGPTVDCSRVRQKPNQICPGRDNNKFLKDLNAASKLLKAKKAELAKWDKAAKRNFKKWFGAYPEDAGTTSKMTEEEARKVMQHRIDKMIELNNNLKVSDFKKARPEDLKAQGLTPDEVYAYVYPGDKQHTVYIGKLYCSSPNSGGYSKASTLLHEMSHFEDIGGTEDHAYGPADCKDLAKNNPHDALYNADNFAFYMGNVK